MEINVEGGGAEEGLQLGVGEKGACVHEGGSVCACVRVCVLMRLLYVFVHFRVSVSSYASKTCLDSVKK